MFSALKFIAAAAIVALFGGFLLAGVLTTPQGDEMVPAAVTESPEPEAEQTTPPPAPMTTDELLALAVTEEVEPGVLRVVDDGLGPLDYPVDWEYPYDIVAGHDGGIYVFEPGHYTRLGSGPYRGTHKGFDWDLEDAFPSDAGVAPDGTVWAVFGGRLYSTLWGSGHETQHLPTMVGPEPIEVTSDGTVWAVWRDDSGTVFGYLGADGWTMVGEWHFNSGLHVSDRGEVWAVDPVGWGFFGVHRFVDGAWREEEGSPNGAFDRADADVGVDGTFWGIRDGHYGDPSGDDRLVRFDGTEWTTFQPPDWSRPDDRSRWGEPHVAPDGALWVPPQHGVVERDDDLGGGRRNVCGYDINGVARFDGETWSRFLQGHCIEAMDIAADGSVWMLASQSGARFPLVAHLYVITPEAVAASE